MLADTSTLKERKSLILSPSFRAYIIVGEYFAWGQLKKKKYFYPMFYPEAQSCEFIAKRILSVIFVQNVYCLFCLRATQAVEHSDLCFYPKSIVYPKSTECLDE